MYLGPFADAVSIPIFLSVLGSGEPPRGGSGGVAPHRLRAAGRTRVLTLGRRRVRVDVLRVLLVSLRRRAGLPRLLCALLGLGRLAAGHGGLLVSRGLLPVGGDAA